MENTWEYPTTFDDEEPQQQRCSLKKQLRNQQIFKTTGRCRCNFVECNQPHRCQYENNFQETSSSSNSSSSSSSDSEEEFTTTMNKPFNKTCRKQTQHMTNMESRREFLSVVELEGLRPQEVYAEVNPKCRILLLKLKVTNTQTKQQLETPCGDKLVRVLALPGGIVLEKLQVQVVPRFNCLLVKAPFTRYTKEQTWQQQGRFLPTWLPIRVTVKNTVNIDTIRAAQHYLHQVKDFPTGWFSYDRFKRYWKQQQRVEDSTRYPFNQQQTTDFSTSRNKWSKLQHQLPMNIPNIHSNTELMPITEVIFDEVINKPVMLLKVNVIGFRTEEVKVRVEETQRLLIVEAVKKTCNTQEHTENFQEQEMEQHALTTKYLRREFFLPRFLDVEHIDFRVLKTGILIVKLPIVKQHLKNLNCFTCRIPECGGCSEEMKKDLLNYNTTTEQCWEKPMRP